MTGFNKGQLVRLHNGEVGRILGGAPAGGYRVHFYQEQEGEFPGLALGEFLVTKAEARHVLYFLGDITNGKDGGGFVHSLLRTITEADENNLIRLRRGFPGYVAAMKDWYQRELVERLDEED